MVQKKIRIEMQVHKNRNVPTEIILPHTYCVLPSTKVIISLERKCKKFFLLEIPLPTHSGLSREARQPRLGPWLDFEN